jgi:hypothetical protein
VRSLIDVRVESRHSLVELSLVYGSSVLAGIHLVHHQNNRQGLSVRKLDVSIDVRPPLEEWYYKRIGLYENNIRSQCTAK